MTDAESQFLKDGINRYSEACAIIDAFRKLAANHMAAVLGESLKRHWPDFTPTGSARAGQPRRQPFGEYAGSGRWGFATCEGGVSKSPMTRVEAGIWWNVPWDSHETVFYLRCYNVDERASFILESPHPTVSFRLDEQVLYLTTGESPDVDGAFGQLVEVAARATIRFPER